MTDVPVGAVADGTRFELSSIGDVVDALRRGATLQAWGCERHDERIGELCRRLGDTVGGRHVHANLFLSPRPDRRGLPPHRDRVDALIVQLAGRKRWQIWEPVMVPSGMAESEHLLDVGDHEPALVIDLEPGDVLFVRRGDPHVADTLEGPSLHVGFAIERPTSGEVLAWLVDRGRRADALATPMPWLESERGAWLADAVGTLDAGEIAVLLEDYMRDLPEPRIPPRTLPRTTATETVELLAVGAT